ncbi:MAG: PDZ domain-containing protein [Hungatella sp.]|jgi:S1-C subfamily serine protease|nr:PDZ domain-containing protein [Hungatella sp.]
MPELNSPEKEPSRKRQFIREKIAKPPMTRKQAAGRFLAWLFIAVLGGTAAGASYAVVTPLARRYLEPQTTEESIMITIPKDDPGDTQPGNAQTGADSSLEDMTESDDGEQTETSSGDMPESDEEESSAETETETEPLEEVIQSVLEDYTHSVRDINTLYGTMREVIQEADRGIVEVHSVKREVDWFDNPVETAGLFAGVIIASTGQEFLILTPEGAVEQADSIKVTFADGSEADGIIKQKDTLSGMAIVSVGADQLEEDTVMEITALKLGNSYSMKQGDPVAALGAPAGVVHSIAYGNISYVAKNVQVPDGATRLLYADIKSNAKAGTFLINTSGEVVGWVTGAYDEESASGLTIAMAISDYKAVLEKMSNGQPIPYLGIRGQEVSSAKALEGVPMGIYVTECIPDGPAYDAGIQNGDIIVGVGGQDISTMKDYQNQMEILTSGAVVTVVVQRRGIDEYKELEYEVSVGAR